MGRIIAVVNRKGGVGKTTTTVNLGHALARSGKRVLIVDLDTQRASVSTWLSKEPFSTLELADVLQHPENVTQAIAPSTCENVDILRGSVRTKATMMEVEQTAAPNSVIKRLIRQVGGYDTIILDCPPALDRIVIAALVATNDVIVPIRAQGMSLEAAGEVLQLIDELVEEEIRPDRPIVRPLLTEMNNTKQAKAVGADISNVETLQAFTRSISRNEKVSESFNFRKSIFDYDPRAKGAEDYRAVADELLESLAS